MAEWRKRNNWFQEALAVKMGVKRSSESAYEAGRKTPDVLTLLQLMNLAYSVGDSETAKWFMEKSGIRPEVLTLSAAEKRSELLRPPDGSLVRVPRARRGGEAEQKEGDDLLFDPRAVAGIGLVSYIAVGEGETGEPLGAGGVVVLDESSNEAASLRPFWDKIILLEAETAEARRDIQNLSLLVGKLGLKRLTAGPTFTWQILLHPWTTVQHLVPYSVGIFLDDSALVNRGTKYGQWRDRESFRKGMEAIETQSKDWAERHAVLGAGFKILGIVTAIIPKPGGRSAG